MEIYNIPEIARNVFGVGSKDWNRRIFDSLIPLPEGTSYNSYLVKGEKKTALIDTVNPGFEEELETKINMVSDLEKVEEIGRELAQKMNTLLSKLKYKVYENEKFYFMELISHLSEILQRSLL